MGLFSRRRPAPPAEEASDAGAPHVPGVAEVHARLKDARSTRLMHPRRMRAGQLRALDRLLEENTQDLLEALEADLGKHPAEARLTELELLKDEIHHAQLYLTEWMEAKHVKVPLALQPAMGKTEAQPKGMVLIIGAWNYPVQLLLSPLVGALAAGNTVALKPSELAPATSALLARLVPRYLDRRVVAVVEGGPDVAQSLLEQPWDHILFTGSERVGRIVARAAAEHLTPVTLELGGKCPAVVGDGNMAAVARRIAHGKFINAGQTCTAPDYVLLVGADAQRLPAQLVRALASFYGKNPAKNRDYGRIVNRAAFDRLVRYIEDAEIDPNVTVVGGDFDAESLYIEPTLLLGVSPDDAVMQEEIFGPILPILSVESFDAALEFIAARPEPLAAYLFSDRPRWHTAFEDRVRAGGIAYNVCNLHVAVPTLPFGGVGASGMGSYHGRYGFATFSQLRPVLSKTAMVDTLRIAYPPYRRGKAHVMRTVRAGSAKQAAAARQTGGAPSLLEGDGGADGAEPSAGGHREIGPESPA
ncbi:aldehyde dehydrogenase family protein [Zhihengliuella sp.]|uniref:aldehyde dehydrogenase family protein n=1 Tax=Zhihengliuella sp. TaxID=1954483 RepID=UPI002810BD62|nr:aldehyde dehydrogenase family protein [Zhihengliuella sp.]